MVPAMQRVALSLALALLLAPSAPVVAQAPEIIKLGDAQGWEAYTDAGKGAKICYLIGKPAKSEPAGAKRSAIFASVTHRPQVRSSSRSRRSPVVPLAAASARFVGKRHAGADARISALAVGIVRDV